MIDGMGADIKARMSQEIRAEIQSELADVQNHIRKDVVHGVAQIMQAPAMQKIISASIASAISQDVATRVSEKVSSDFG